jgi:hypothetical protein
MVLVSMLEQNASKGKIMYSIWFLGLNDEPIEIKVHTIESAQKIWEDLEISGWHMISTYP